MSPLPPLRNFVSQSYTSSQIGCSGQSPPPQSHPLSPNPANLTLPPNPTEAPPSPPQRSLTPDLQLLAIPGHLPFSDLRLHPHSMTPSATRLPLLSGITPSTWTPAGVPRDHLPPHFSPHFRPLAPPPTEGRRGEAEEKGASRLSLDTAYHWSTPPPIPATLAPIG